MFQLFRSTIWLDRAGKPILDEGRFLGRTRRDAGGAALVMVPRTILAPALSIADGEGVKTPVLRWRLACYI